MFSFILCRRYYLLTSPNSPLRLAIMAKTLPPVNPPPQQESWAISGRRGHSLVQNIDTRWCFVVRVYFIMCVGCGWSVDSFGNDPQPNGTHSDWLEGVTAKLQKLDFLFVSRTGFENRSVQRIRDIRLETTNFETSMEA